MPNFEYPYTFVFPALCRILYWLAMWKPFDCERRTICQDENSNYLANGYLKFISWARDQTNWESSYRRNGLLFEESRWAGFSSGGSIQQKTSSHVRELHKPDHRVAKADRNSNSAYHNFGPSSQNKLKLQQYYFWKINILGGQLKWNRGNTVLLSLSQCSNNRLFRTFYFALQGVTWWRNSTQLLSSPVSVQQTSLDIVHLLFQYTRNCSDFYWIDQALWDEGEVKQYQRKYCFIVAIIIVLCLPS